MKLAKWFCGIIGGITLIISLAGCNGNTSFSQSPTPTSATAKTSSYQLESISRAWSREYGYITLEGEVRNISGLSINEIVAVAKAYTEDGTFVKSDDALIDYQPLLAGQASPFKVIMSDNPAIKSMRVEFKKFWGGTISTKYIDPDLKLSNLEFLNDNGQYAIKVDARNTGSATDFFEINLIINGRLRQTGTVELNLEEVKSVHFKIKPFLNIIAQEGASSLTINVGNLSTVAKITYTQ